MKEVRGQEYFTYRVGKHASKKENEMKYLVLRKIKTQPKILKVKNKYILKNKNKNNCLFHTPIYQVFLTVQNAYLIVDTYIGNIHLQAPEAPLLPPTWYPEHLLCRPLS